MTEESLKRELNKKIGYNKIRVKQLLSDGYARAKHNREKLDLYAIPDNGVTAGANNVYWNNGFITYGTTSLGNSNAQARIQLPSDYVAGENLTLRISYKINQVSATIDYDVNFRYGNESTSFTSANNPTGQWTSNATALRPNHEDLTITGTNLSAGDDLEILLEMDDNSATDNTVLLSLKLIIPVDKRD